MFDWKALPMWCDTIAEFVPSDLRTQLPKRFATSRDRFRYRDDFHAFEQLYREMGDFDSLLATFVDRFPQCFPFVRMYHCCRCIDPASYYDAGMLVLDRSVADRSFRDRYLNNPVFPDVSELHIAASITSMADSYQRERVIYFGLDDRFLVQYCSHYLTHGSEYCQALAVHLSQLTGYDIKGDLARRGTPTVFCVQMPVERLDATAIRELGQNAFYAWAYGVAHSSTEPWELDFGIAIDTRLPPENIIEHYTPVGFS